MTSDIALTYTLTADDLVRSWRQHFRARVLRSRWALWTGLGAAAYLLGTVGVGVYWDDWTVVWLVVAVWAILPGIMVFNNFVVVPLSASRSGLCGSTFEVQVGSGGVSWRNDQVDASHSWTRFLDIAEGRDYFLFYVGQTTYFPVPKRAFDGQPAIDRMRELISDRTWPAAASQNSEANPSSGEIFDKKAIALRFRLTEAEHVMLFRQAVFRQIVQSRPTLALHLLSVVLASYGLFMMVTARFEAVHIVLVAPAVFVLSALLSDYFWGARNAVKKSPAFDKEQSVLVRDGEIVFDNGVAKVGIDWSRIAACHEKEDLLILRVGEGEFLALAKRGFESAEDEALFGDMLKRRLPDN